jgi:hypothetical protein
MQNTGLTGAQIPDAETFRDWVATSIKSLSAGENENLVVSVVSVNAGMSVNLLGQFLNGHVSSISLTRSAGLQKYLGSVAHDRGFTLPACGVQSHGN